MQADQLSLIIYAASLRERIRRRDAQLFQHRIQQRTNATVVRITVCNIRRERQAVLRKLVYSGHSVEFL